MSDVALAPVETDAAPAADKAKRARPFVKWVGGKDKLLADLLPLLPPKNPKRTYYEPFVGGGAMFYAMQDDGGHFCDAVLSDANPDLMTTYRAVKDDVAALITCLGLLAREHDPENPADLYYRIRNRSQADALGIAARFIYLNKTCFNGLYRTNKLGTFNVPVGKFKTPPRILDEPNLLACSRALTHASFLLTRPIADFMREAVRPIMGDFVYFDPPYVPLSVTSSFTAYGKEGFGEKDQRDLAALFARLAAGGVDCMLSNSDTPLVRELYKDFHLTEVSRAGTVSSKAGGRGRVAELVVRSYR